MNNKKSACRRRFGLWKRILHKQKKEHGYSQNSIV
jgi:hypothetical protein